MIYDAIIKLSVIFLNNALMTTRHIIEKFIELVP